jgi:nocardicin N-oxygenase
MTVLTSRTESESHRYPFDGGTPRAGLHPLYHRLRIEEPVARITMPFGAPAWLVSGYADVIRVLNDDDVFSLNEANGLIPEFEAFDQLLMGMKPDDHRRVRGFINRAFTPRRTEAMRGLVAQRVDDLLAAAKAGGEPADLVEGLARPLALGVILDLMGVPAESRATLTALGFKLLEIPEGTDGELQDQIQSALGEIGRHLFGIVVQRAAEPQDDLISDLVAQNEQAKRTGAPHMSDPEFIGLLLLLVMAGSVPTTSLLSQIALDLAVNPEHLDFVRESARNRTTAVREYARFYPVGGDDGRPRVVTEDVVLSGVLLRAGEIVVAAKDSASFDSHKFDDPMTFKLDRHPNPLTAFGHGPHVCIGAGLALMMGEELCRALSDRDEFPHYRLAVAEDDVEWIKGLAVRGPMTVPALWS